MILSAFRSYGARFSNVLWGYKHWAPTELRLGPFQMQAFVPHPVKGAHFFVSSGRFSGSSRSRWGESFAL